MKNHYGCPIQATSNIMAGKWKVLILWHLSFGAMRFGELRDKLESVTEKVLTTQLKELERDGLITRTDAGTIPPRVEYALTPMGTKLVPVMEVMCEFGVTQLGVPPKWPRTVAA